MLTSSQIPVLISVILVVQPFQQVRNKTKTVFRLKTKQIFHKFDLDFLYLFIPNGKWMNCMVAVR